MRTSIHAAATAELARRTGANLSRASRNDRYCWIERLPQQAQMFEPGCRREPIMMPTLAGRWRRVRVGESGSRCATAPGHTPGTSCSSTPSRSSVGVLFAGLIGRTDLPGGNQRAAARPDPRKALVPLGDDVTFPPGHGRPRLSARASQQPVRQNHCLAAGAAPPVVSGQTGESSGSLAFEDRATLSPDEHRDRPESFRRPALLPDGRSRHFPEQVGRARVELIEGDPRNAAAHPPHCSAVGELNRLLIDAIPR